MSKMSDDEVIQRCKADLIYVAPECWAERIAYHCEAATDKDRFSRETAAFVEECWRRE